MMQRPFCDIEAVPHVTTVFNCTRGVGVRDASNVYVKDQKPDGEIPTSSSATPKPTTEAPTLGML
jgi:hypothetical protein